MYTQLELVKKITLYGMRCKLLAFVIILYPYLKLITIETSEMAYLEAHHHR